MVLTLLLVLLLASSCSGAKEAGSLNEIEPAVVVAGPDSLSPATMTSLDIIEHIEAWKASEAERLVREARERELRLWVVIGFLLAITVSVIWYFITRKVLNDKQLEQQKAENERLMTIAEELQGKLASRSGRDTALLERLCEQYYIYEGTDNLQGKVLREVRSVIEGLRTDTSSLEKTLDEDCGGLMTRFRAQFPRLKDEDLQLFCYLASGFSATTISTLMEKDKQYIYNRVWRLRGRIASSDAPDKEQFLKYISK